MHQGIKTYLDGKFYLAPLDNPQTILDIGYASISLTFGESKNTLTLLRYFRAGSGIWCAPFLSDAVPVFSYVVSLWDTTGQSRARRNSLMHK